VSQGDAVNELQVPTHGKSPCKATHPYPRARDPLLHECRGRFTLERGVGGEDHLTDRPLSQSVFQQTHAQGVGTDAVEW